MEIDSSGNRQPLPGSLPASQENRHFFSRANPGEVETQSYRR